MIYTPFLYLSSASPTDRSTLNTAPSGGQRNRESPRKPDWLLILVGVLFLITLLIAWAVDLPAFNW